MSGNFEDVHLEWNGQKYTIRKERVLKAIARIEDVVTMVELQRFWERQTTPMAKIAMAYGSVLRYAGAKVTDDEVYIGMFGAEGTSADQVVLSINNLIEMMVPPTTKEVASSSGNSEPAAVEKTTDS